MKYIILFLISFSFAQVIAPIGMGESKIDTFDQITTIGLGLGVSDEEWAFQLAIQGGNIEPIAADEKICWTADEIITVKDLFDYAEECYNDSSPIYDSSSYTITIECDENGKNCIGTKIDDVYYISKTPTFGGFIEWLKK